MGIREQISAVLSVGTLIGVSGSALHLAAFAAPGTRIIEIGDARSGVDRLRNQRVIDAACGHPTAMVPFTGDKPSVDLAQLESFLDQAGL